MATKDGAWLSNAQIIAGIDVLDNTHPLNCDIFGTLNVNATLTAGSIDIGKVDQGLAGLSPWLVNVNNFPGTQNINVTNASIPVTGTFFQTTQPVSIASTVNVGVTNFPASQVVTEANVDRNFGTWSYYSGVSGTVVVTGGQRVIGIGCHATSAGSFTINGGPSIPVPASVSVNIEPLGNLTAPTLIFTATDSYFIEVVL